MSKPLPTGSIPQRKKSISKAPATKGREDSRAVQVKRDKQERVRAAQGTGSMLSKVYQEREHEADRTRKVKRGFTKAK